MKPLDIQFWRSAEEVESNRAIWEDLYWASGSSPYLSYEWFSTALKYFQRDNRLYVGLMKVDQRPVAIVPLEIVKKKIGPLTLNILQFALGGWTLRNGAIVREGMDELLAIREVINALKAEKLHWVFCILSKCPISLLTDKNKKQYCSLPDDIAAVMAGRTVVIETPDTWKAYQKTLSKTHRSNISWRKNVLGRRGEVKAIRCYLNPVLDPGKLDTLMNDAVFVSRNSWQHEAQEGWAISDPKTGDFFIDVSHRLAARGMLDLSVLYLDNQPISFIWGPGRGQHTTSYKVGYDKSFSRFSPGLVHLAKHIEDSIERGVKTIDLGPEFFEYKSSWGKRHDELATIYISSWNPAVFHYLHKVKKTFTKFRKRSVHK